MRGPDPDKYCPTCGWRQLPERRPAWYTLAAKQVVMWMGWGAIGGGSWVVVGELIKRFVVKA